MKKKNFKIALIVLSVIILLGALGIGGFIGNYFYDLAINPYSSKDAIFGEPNEEIEKLKVKEDEKWLLESSNYKDTYINSFDNLKLHAYQVKNEKAKDKWAIVVHGYTSAWSVFVHQLNALFGLKPFPFMQLSNIVVKMKAGYSLEDASAIEQVKNSKTPILFIHGDKDDFVPYSMMDELYNATSSDKEKLTIEGAGHDHSYLVNPKLYWTSINTFLNKYVK